MLPVEHTFLSTISQFGSKIINKIAASYDGKTKVLYLKFGNFEIKNITIEQLNSLVHQRSEVADILKKIIVDRQIIWQSYDAEHIDECVRSLITLELYCTEKSKQLYSNSKNSFYADLLQVIGSEANETRREFERAIAADSILLKLNSKSRQKAAELLTPFRLKVIPII